MRVSAVIIGRNDNYGGHLNARATYCLNTMLDTFDEVIYVDWNTDGPRTLVEDIPVTVHPERLVVYKVTPDMCRDHLMGPEVYAQSQKCCEVLARNIGIRRATGDIIVSTNIDIIPPRREYLDVLLQTMTPTEFWTVAKHDVDVKLLDEIFVKENRSYIALRDALPLYYGLNPLSKRLIVPALAMNKAILDTIPTHAHHNASSLICACGDFQIAYKSLWYTIKGFEESMKKRLYADSVTQYKAIMAGATVRAHNFPPVYHIDHERCNAPEVQNTQTPDIGKNPETWGFSDVEFPTVHIK
jgi:hypothetical protein